MFLSLLLPLVIPMMLGLIVNEGYSFTQRAAVEVINVELSVFTYLFINGLVALVSATFNTYFLMMTPIFALILLIIPIMLIACLVAAAIAFQGEEFRYPLIIRFF